MRQAQSGARVRTLGEARAVESAPALPTGHIALSHLGPGEGDDRGYARRNAAPKANVRDPNGHSRGGPGPVHGTPDDLPPDRLRANAPDYPAGWGYGAPNRRPRGAVGRAGPGGETDDRTEVGRLTHRRRGHGWRRS